MIRHVIAERDPALRATVVRVTSLRYAGGSDPSLDRPAHVRAGSGIAWMGERLVVVQDDANFVALVHPESGEVASMALPAGVAGRRQFGDALGNKAHKLDLESIVSIRDVHGDARLLAFGSGSTGQRETVVSLGRIGGAAGADDPAVVMHALPAFYAALRATVPFAGSEMNVEAVVHLGPAPGGNLRLFNRGNGSTLAGVAPVNATCDVSWARLAEHLSSAARTQPPAPTGVVQYDLGAIGGLPLTFTDATLVHADADGARCCIAYTAAAEASPDTYRDGAVAGSAVGVIVDDAGKTQARWALLCDDAGSPFMGKVEGIALHPGDRTRCYLVVDRDSPEEPSELCEARLEGDWFTNAS